MPLTIYGGDYAAMLTDAGGRKMQAGETWKFCRAGEEIAVLLLGGRVAHTRETQRAGVSRRNAFTGGPGLPDVHRLDDPPSGGQSLAPNGPLRGRALRLISEA